MRQMDLRDLKETVAGPNRLRPAATVQETFKSVVPGRVTEGQVGADGDGCTDTMNRGKEPRPAKHTQTPPSP
ncbi:hypothetical protein EYF80_000401 [Liparis tanakae]|uniref:Uncharacterized protein n=1 Tax=Liparis tanakae TaxID=230148 RepID=A0A4Z2JGX7_9TELE|nr:hypothetical protein EYF80_000401 [Liparis tanakae]